MTIILYCSLPAILKLIQIFLVEHDQVHNIKVSVPNCGNISGAGPHFCYWGTCAPTQPPTSYVTVGQKERFFTWREPTVCY